MMTTTMNQRDTTTTTTTTTKCGNCGTQERWLLHHVRLRSSYRRLCTSCVLKLHPSSHCPTCFDVYDTLSPSPHDALVCLKCSSISHSACVVASVVSTPYICPHCANPNLPLFNITRVPVVDGEATTAPNENRRPISIDKKSATVLLAAAKIASVSMRKAALAARGEAEKKVKEAALHKKRAREALEHLASLSLAAVKEKKPKPNQLLRVVEGMDSNCEAVGSTEKERLQGFRTQNAVLGPPKNSVSVSVSVGMEHLNVNKKERSGGDLVHLLNRNALGEMANNGFVSVPSVGGPLPHLLNGNGRKEDFNSH